VNFSPSLARGLLALAGICVALWPAHDANAVSDRIYQSSFAGGTYKATASLGSQLSSSYTVPVGGSPVAIHNLIMAAQGSYLDLQTRLTQAAAAALAQEARKAEADYSAYGLHASSSFSSPGILAGTFTASLAGLPNGNFRLALSGLHFTGTGSISGSAAGGTLRLNCTARIAVLGLGLSVEYNPLTGAVSNAAPTFQVQIDPTCNSNLNWLLPGLGPYVEGEVEAGVRDSVATFNAASGRLIDINPQRALFGFVDALEASTYMVGGTDVGMYLRNNIGYLYANREIVLTVRQPASFFAPTFWNNRPGPSSYAGSAFSVRFFDSGNPVAGLDVTLTNYFNWILIAGEE
jgi:hypothetical protein